MKKLILIFSILLFSVSLISCQKSSAHSNKEINEIKIYNKDDEYLFSISEDQNLEFINDLNGLKFKNHSGTIKQKNSNYVIIFYQTYTVKITNLYTYRINSDGLTIRNRNRQYEEKDFDDLLNRYNSSQES